MLVQKFFNESVVLRRKVQRRVRLIALGSFKDGKCTLMHRHGGKFMNG